MLAPPTFNLPEPVKMTPRPPCPPSYLKHQVYDDPHVFDKVDTHAIRVSQNLYPSFKDLMWDLVFRYQLTDLEKARVIFRWMTACDMNALDFKTNNPNSPEEVLLSLKNLKGSYANAFELMCSYAGLCCLTITGYAKGVSYKPGDMFQKDGFNHTWNVIYLQNSWQLIDAHWASRYLTSNKNSQESIVYQYDDFYFIMEPQQAVYSHFPEKTEWQLLEKPLKLNQFENLPLTKSQFFKCGMDFKSQHHGVVHSKDGRLKMNLGFWKPDCFTYKLQKDDGTDKFEGISLKHYVLQETVNNQINFFFRFPCAGVYYLTIFAQELNEFNQPINKENTFRAACEYKIIADKAMDNVRPYPMTCHDTNWGPSWSLVSHYNLAPQQEDGLITITSPSGKPFVKSEIVFDKKRDEIGLLCKLRKNGLDDEDILDQYIEIAEKPDKTTFIISLPEPGEYGLEIYANEPEEGDTYTHVCQYLLDFEPPPDYKPQPSIFGSAKGDRRLLSHKPSKIRDMYNYEKDASPIGYLPKPYMPTQYAPEDVTLRSIDNCVYDGHNYIDQRTTEMIPGKTKVKPKPFEYRQNNDTTTTGHRKNDDYDLEMPDFLPPPPPAVVNQNILPQIEVNVNTAPLPPPIIGSSSNPYMDNRIDQRNPTNQNAVYGGKNSHLPSNQQMNAGDKFNMGQKNINYSLQTAAPFTKSNVKSDPVDGTPQISQKPTVMEKPFSYKTEPIDNDSSKLQPYLTNVEKGQSPQLSRKVYGTNVPFSISRDNTNVKDQQGGKHYPNEGAQENTNPVHARYSDKNDEINLSELNMVSSAFGKQDSITVQQPYLQNLLGGGSPILSRKVTPKPPSESNQNTLNKPKMPSDLLNSLNREQDLTSPDSKRQSGFRGYGRPNFKTTTNSTDITPTYITSQSNQNPIVTGTPESTNVKINPAQNKQYSSDASLKFGSGNNQSPNTFQTTGSKPIAFPSPGINQYQINPKISVGSSLSPQQQQKSSNQYPPPLVLGSGGSNQYNSTNSQYSPNTAPIVTGQPERYSGTNQYHNVTNDPKKKSSNIALTLSPAGFKNPNKSGADLLYDQYNKQYEDSSNIVPSPFQKYRPDESTANWTSGPVQKEPPTNFELKPIAIEEQLYKPEIQALPSKISTTVAISPEETSKIFQKVDEHAMQVSAQQQDSFNQLIWQLIYARNITDELEKVRVIFLWLCTKDLHKMNFDNTKQDSPEEILMGIRTGKSTYAQIFLTLCRYAGLHCKLIVGYAKGADYVPGMKFQGRQGEHSWNAVLIEGVWRLIDCHWAARRLIGKEHKPENVRYELDMFYFLANPSQLIYTHFPHDKDWQLLHHSITIEEFELLAPVKSMFFKYNLDLVTHKNAVIQSHGPEIELRIAFPKGIEERLLFTFTLSFNDGKEDYNDIPLLRYGRQEYDFENNHSVFWIRTPTPGSYKLLIYTKMINVEPNVSENDSQKMFGAICEYKIDADFHPKQALSQFPSCQSSTYGPNEMYKKYPIESQNLVSSFYIDNGAAEIRFLIRKPDIRIIAKLFDVKVKNNDQLTEQCVLQRMIGKEEAVISVFLPEAGEYGLEVYANDPKKNGNSFYAVWQYFIVSTSASIVSGLPSLQPGFLGPYEPRFSDYGMSTYSHKDPFIVANTGDLCIQMKTTRDKPVRIMAQLIHCTHNVNEICSDQILQLGRDGVVYFLIRSPHKGFFKLLIFALPYTEVSESLPGVFNYLIEANQTSQSKVGFPQQFAQWKEGCYLYEPTDGVLGLDTASGKPDKITFRMDIPRAKNVAVIVDEKWTKLEKNTDGVWNGNVDMRDIWRKSSVNDLIVCANYSVTMDDSYTTILKYSIQN